MKKILSVLAILGLISSISSCWVDNNPETPKESPFSIDYPTNEKTSKYFLENDDYDVITMAGPYYQGKQSLDFPGMKEFDKLRKLRVDEAIELTEDFLSSSMKTKKSLEEARRDYIDLLEVLFSWNKKYKEISNEITQILVSQQLQEDSLYLAISSIEKPVGKDKAVIAAMEYSKTALTMRFASVIEANIREFIVLSTKTEFEFEKNSEVEDDLKKFTKNMDKSSIFEDLNANQLIAIDLANTIKQIHTADYYIALTSLAYVQDQLPKIKKEIAKIKTNDDISNEDIEFINEYAKLFETYTSDLQKQLNNFDKTTLINVPEDETVSVLFPTTYASSTGYFAKAFWALKSGAKKAIAKTVNIVDKWLTYTWIKKKYQQAKKAWWFALESLQAWTKTWMDLVLWKRYGNSTKDTWDIIRQNFERMDKNIKEGRAGADILHTAYDYVDSIDNGAEHWAELAIAKLMWWKWNVSWAAGKISKLTAWMITWFAKGVYKVSNQDSSKATIAEWLLDIWLSFVGGSKTVLSGSKALSSWWKALLWIKGLWKKGIKFLWKAFANANKKTLKDITKESVKKFISNSAKNGFNAVMKANYKNMIKIAAKKLKDTSGKWMKALISNAKIEAKNSYKEFVKNVFKQTYDWYVKSLTAIFWGTPGAFFDNIVGNAVDWEIKWFVKEAVADDYDDTLDEELDDFIDDYLDEEITADDESNISDIIGSYPGNIKFTDVYVSEESRAKTKEEIGCDLAQIIDLEGTSQPITLQIISTDGNKGTLLMKMEGLDDPELIPFIYENWVITVQDLEDWSSIILKKTKDGFIGNINLNFDDSVKIKSDIKVKK